MVNDSVKTWQQIKKKGFDEAWAMSKKINQITFRLSLIELSKKPH